LDATLYRREERGIGDAALDGPRDRVALAILVGPVRYGVVEHEGQDLDAVGDGLLALEPSDALAFVLCTRLIRGLPAVPMGDDHD